MASTISAATLATAHGQGWPDTIRPHRANALCSCCSCVAAAVAAACSCADSPSLWARTRAGSARTVSRASPMNPGTRVSAEIIVTTTTIAAARPSDADEADAGDVQAQDGDGDSGARDHDRGP